jgi:hypothetical protein
MNWLERRRQSADTGLYRGRLIEEWIHDLSHVMQEKREVLEGVTSSGVDQEVMEQEVLTDLKRFVYQKFGDSAKPEVIERLWKLSPFGKLESRQSKPSAGK